MPGSGRQSVRFRDQGLSVLQFQKPERLLPLSRPPSVPTRDVPTSLFRLFSERRWTRQLRTRLRVRSVAGFTEGAPWSPADKAQAGGPAPECCLVPACPLQHLRACRTSKRTSSPRGQKATDRSTSMALGHSQEYHDDTAVWGRLLDRHGDPEKCHIRGDNASCPASSTGYF